MIFAPIGLALCALATEEWRGFRGTDSSASTNRPAPITWNATENIAWKAELPGPGSSSPIVVGERVFVTCWSGYAVDRDAPGDLADLRRHLFCFDRKSGEALWQADVEPAATEDEYGGRMAVHGYASGTPVSDGESVYVFYGKAGVFAYDLEGQERWSADVGKGSSPWTTGSGSSLTLGGDLLFVNASDESHSIRALDKRSGELVWERSTEALDQSYGTPLLTQHGEEPVLVLALLEEIWGLEPATGEPRWTVTTGTNGALAPTVVEGDGIVYSFGGQTRVRSCAVRLGGEGDVTSSHLAWTSVEGTYVSTPLLFEGYLYWADDGGIAHCASADTGEIVYKERLEGQFYSSPVRAGDELYMVSRESGVFVLLAGPAFELLAHNVIEGDETLFDGTPAIVGGDIYLRSGRALYCIAD